MGHHLDEVDTGHAQSAFAALIEHAKALEARIEELEAKAKTEVKKVVSKAKKAVEGD